MPLSEDEQRILQDIERSFYESDPKFANAVSATSLYRHAGRICKWAAAGFFVSLIGLLVTFIPYPVVGVLFFGAMLVCAAIFARNIHRITSSGLREAAESERARQATDSFHDMRSKFERRFKKP